MMMTLLKSKIHRATITGSNLAYEGSISIDPDLYGPAGMRENEQVDVLNLNTGSRLTTYIINGKPREICLNGAAARMAEIGDKVIIVSYGLFSEEELDGYSPFVVFVDDANQRTDTLESPTDHPPGE